MKKVSLVIGLIVVVFVLFRFLLISYLSSVPVAENGNNETLRQSVPHLILQRIVHLPMQLREL